MALALFDLDHTLLSGDSDVFWCDFLVAEGVIDADWRRRAAELATAYTAGTVAPRDYCAFQASLLAGRSVAELQPLRERFLAEVVRPHIPDDARTLLARHREAGDTLVLTTATTHVVSELTARDLGFEHYLCSELEMQDDRYTGRTRGVPNMRTGKLERLRTWMAERGEPEQSLRRAAFYSDSINDLALLSAVGRPTVVDPDPRLESTARRKGWAVLRLRR